jgi:hypothetical protein
MVGYDFCGKMNLPKLNNWFSFLYAVSPKVPTAGPAGQDEGEVECGGAISGCAGVPWRFFEPP